MEKLIKYFIILLFQLLFYILTSCRTTYSEQEETTSSIVKNNNGNLVLNTAEPGYPTKKFVFYEAGQTCTLRNGERIELVFENIDFNMYTFEIETDLATQELTLKLVNIEETRVFLSSKCQTIKRMVVGKLPKIELASNLNPEQIVITPLFDDTCNVIGYEFRYGSEESGCKAFAKQTLQKFNDCTKKRTNKTSSSTQKKKVPCPNELLGLPCK
ncbi:MAG: hypothetical protein N2560_10380 [Ignavibacteria bacterium]|nr:hypothetical protein [Ignavibacteria bacterium]